MTKRDFSNSLLDHAQNSANALARLQRNSTLRTPHSALEDTLLAMSAFVGLLHLDGRPCHEDVVGAMLDPLKHRVEEAGWNARRVRVDGPVGFGYAPLASTPQARFERENPDEAQTLARSGQMLWITGHIRLDNRLEIAGACRISASEAQRWNDGRLVLEAYALWGEETPRHLRGDFAFAIWDAARRRLFVARDRFGTRPFYYAFLPGQLLAFGNEIKALWAVPQLSPEVNQAHAISYLLVRHDDKERTFYEGVRRLPPATQCVLSLDCPDAFLPTTYWTLDSSRQSHFAGDDETAEALRETFFASVKERTRSEDDFSLFLSGGLDSSSIAGTAPRVAPQNRPVRALSAVFNRFPECDERALIEKNLAFSQGALDSILLPADDLSPFHDVERVLWHLDGPSAGPRTCPSWAQYAPLQNAGSHVLLDGHGGDEVVCMGYGRVSELLRSSDYVTAWRELRLLRRYGVVDAPPVRFLWPALLKQARGTRGIGRLLSVSAKRSQGRNAPSSAPWSFDEEMEAPVLRLLRPQALEMLEDAPNVRPARGVQEEHVNILNGGLQSAALETLDAMAGAHALEARMPFWEQGMIELCVSLPSDQKMRHGFNRFVMRRAMEGVIPPEVQWRTGKTNFAAQLLFGFCELERARIESTFERWQKAPTALGELVDIPALRELWDSLLRDHAVSDEAGLNVSVLGRVLMLGLWWEKAL